ncbi:MAG: alpha/beta fold hydrolase [Gemmatimonadaceae bacterium]
METLPSAGGDSSLGDYDNRLQVVGQGPPLVYVPGLDGTGALFYRQIPALSRRFRVATYTLRDSATEIGTLIADLARVIRDVAPGGEPPVLVAESFGGALAMSFALEHPAMVRHLVILNSFPFFRPQLRLRLATAGLHLMPWGAMRLMRRMTSFRIHSQHTHRDDVRRFFELTAHTTKQGYLNRLRILTAFDIRDRLPGLRVPLLLLAADEDHLIPSVAQAQLMNALAPHATTIILRGHGHSCFLARSLDLDSMLRAEFR